IGNLQPPSSHFANSRIGRSEEANQTNRVAKYNLRSFGNEVDDSLEMHKAVLTAIVTILLTISTILTICSLDTPAFCNSAIDDNLQ
uniref:KCNMA1 n=1 Tax=Ascaris lumbricoides TaxID=6252 RepID=A0A0M3IFQ1_ASCLU